MTNQTQTGTLVIMNLNFFLGIQLKPQHLFYKPTTNYSIKHKPKDDSSNTTRTVILK